jgi:syntaxin 18
VIWYLQRKLQEAMGIQSEMMEVRISREVEKSKSVLYKTKGLVSLPEREALDAGRVAMGEEKRRGNEPDESAGYTLTDEQMQLFAQENQDMLKHYEDSLDQVRYALALTLALSSACTATGIIQ